MSLFPVSGAGDFPFNNRPTEYRPVKWRRVDVYSHLGILISIAIAVALSFFAPRMLSLAFTIATIGGIVGYIAISVKPFVRDFQAATDEIHNQSRDKLQLNIPSRLVDLPVLYLAVLAVLLAGTKWLWPIATVTILIAAFSTGINWLLKLRSQPLESIESRNQLEAAAVTYAVLLPLSIPVGLLLSYGDLRADVLEVLPDNIEAILVLVPFAIVSGIFSAAYFLLRRLSR